MNIGKRKLSGTTTILLVALLTVSAVLGALTILYTLNIPATWNVTTSQGLVLYQSDGVTRVTAISFTINPLSSQTQNFVLKNTGNHAVNVTDNIPDSTALYTFTTTFLNSTSASQNTISQGGTYAFSITLTDLGMDSSQTYSGNFAYNIATGFSAGSSADSFEETAVNYAADTGQYFRFANDSIGSTWPDYPAIYPIGQQMVYCFTTTNINQSYMIQALTYKLEIWKDTNGQYSLVSTVVDGNTVAYWEDSTHYGPFGNGTSLVSQPLLPNHNITIWCPFTIPNPAGLYYVILTYQSHNAAPAPPLITWTWSFSAGGEYSGSQIGGIEDNSITGATAAGQSGTVSFGLYAAALSAGSTMSCSFSVKIVETGQTIATGGASFASSYQEDTFSYSFTPTVNGALTMQVTATETYYSG